MSALTPRKTAARIALMFGAFLVLLLVIWLVAGDRFFGSFWPRGTSEESLLSAPNVDMKAATRVAQAGADNGNKRDDTAVRISRTPTLIADAYEAYGKPADVEVCGFGVQHVEEYPIGISLPPVTSANTTLNAIARDLASSKIAADRALGFYLQAKLAGEAALESLQIQEPGCGQYATPGSGKPDNPPCSPELIAAQQATRITAAKPLIDMALATSDPNIYATAYYFCSDPLSGKGESRGACAAISAEGWARLDPQNLYPAILVRNPGPFMAGDYKLPAKEPIDDSPLPTALLDARSPRFDRVMAQDNFKQEPVYMQSAISQWLLGASFVSGSSYVASALNYCRPAEAARPSRSQICAGVAKVLAEQGKSILDLSVALTLGERGMLSDSQIAKLKVEKAAYEAQVWKLLSVSPYSCEGMAFSVNYLANLLARGDRGMVVDEQGGELKTKLNKALNVKP